MIKYGITMPVQDGSKAYMYGVRKEPLGFSSVAAAKQYLSEKLGVTDEEIKKQKIVIEPMKGAENGRI